MKTKRNNFRLLGASSNKYGARKVYAVIDGLQRCSRFHSLEMAKRFVETAKDNSEVFVFDSVHEFEIYRDLAARERAGLISCLRRQYVFELLPNQYEIIQTPRGNKRKLLERGLKYTADFVYIDKSNGARVVVDAKSKATRTRDYIIRRKLMLWIHKIKIVEM